MERVYPQQPVPQGEDRSWLDITNEGKEKLGAWELLIAPSDFISQFVDPLPDEAPPDARGGLACAVTVVRNPAPGRVLLRYDFGHGRVIYAKLYPDDLGAHSYQVHKALWDGGFDRESPYQVPEPLAFLPQHRLVLLRGIEGEPLGSALGGNPAVDLVEGSRAAARWLARLHRSPIRVGEPRTVLEALRIFRLFRKLIKAMAARPGHHGVLLNLMATFEGRVRRLPDSRPVAQTHGRYRHEHVFIGARGVAVIDLDKSRPAEPARDVAEFVHALRWTAYRTNADMARADQATAAFLEEYLSRVPGVATAVAGYWSSFILMHLLRYMRRRRIQGTDWQRLLDFHLREMRRAGEVGA